MQRGASPHSYYVFNGVNAYSESNRNPHDTLYYAQNSRFSGGRWGSRPGYGAFGDVQAGGVHPRGLLTYTRFPGGVQVDYVIMYYNSNFYRYDLTTGVSTVIVPPGTWLGGDISVEGDSYNGVLYVCNGSDRVHKITDLTMVEVTNSPRARILEDFGEKMWGIDNVAPATAQYTVTASAATPANIEDWTTGGGASGAQLFGQGGILTSMRKLSQELYFFKQDKIDRCTGFDVTGAEPRPLIEPVTKTGGALNHRSTCKVENDLWFVTPGTFEIRSMGKEAGYFNDTRTEDLSKILQRYKINLDPDQSKATATYNNKIYKLSLQERGSSQNNLDFVYDYNGGAWDFDRSTARLINTVASGNAFFTTDGNSGTLYKDETDYSDNGFPIAWSGKTQLADDLIAGAHSRRFIPRADVFKRARYVFTRGARSQNVIITVFLYGDDFAILDSWTIPAPTSAEIAAANSTIGGLNGQVGDIVGESGYQGTELGVPPVYRFHDNHSTSFISRLFGIGYSANLIGQRVAIDEAKITYIPLPESYQGITS